MLPQQAGRVDLLTKPSLRIDGEAADNQAGSWVAGAGDVNGDGLGDVVVGAPARGALDAGAAYVVFGRETPRTSTSTPSGATAFASAARRRAMGRRPRSRAPAT